MKQNYEIIDEKQNKRLRDNQTKDIYDLFPISMLPLIKGEKVSNNSNKVRGKIITIKKRIKNINETSHLSFSKSKSISSKK